MEDDEVDQVSHGSHVANIVAVLEGNWNAGAGSLEAVYMICGDEREVQ
jgi:hypothetical protein